MEANVLSIRYESNVYVVYNVDLF